MLRANRELAAYFKGQRTEREARAALKTIKAFVRDREHFDAASRPPLPGVAAPKLAAPKAAKESGKRKPAGAHAKRSRRKPHRAVVLRSVKSRNVAPAAEPDLTPEISQTSPTDEAS